MKKKLSLIIWICLCPLLNAQVLDHVLKDLAGKPIHLSRDFLGKVVLVVNTASLCGATPQYEGLQALQDKYQAQGFSVLALPSNDFGEQEPGSALEIATFCKNNYHINFPISEKVTVSGASSPPFVQTLVSGHQDPKLNGPIKWNFEKFLIDRDGNLIERFGTQVEPEDEKIVGKIETLLALDPVGITNYLGRDVATTMHWKGAPWLIRGSRETEEATEKMLEALDVKPNQTVCDLGAGNGYHTLKIAEKVGSKGIVYAVDVQPEMLDMLGKRANEAKLGNIKTIVNQYYNTGLPSNCVDLMLLCDVYHEFSHPVHMLNDIHRALAPDGELVMVEFRAEDTAVPIKKDHKMSEVQIMKELTANGFELSRRYDALPWQHMLVFKKTKE